MKQLLVVLIYLPFFGFTQTTEKNEKPIVLELFTSQGCSSCPPADKLLSKIDNETLDEDVIVLSYHVDYWNYIGWKDPYSDSLYTNRQRLYNQKLVSSSYTPQLIVNGNSHFVGSNESKLRRVLKLKNQFKTVLNLKVSDINVLKNDLVKFNFQLEETPNHLSLKALLVLKEKITSVTRGENRNRTLKNSNIVVNMTSQRINSASGKASIKIPEVVNKEDKLYLVVLIQNSDLDIIESVKLKL